MILIVFSEKSSRPTIYFTPPVRSLDFGIFHTPQALAPRGWALVHRKSLCCLCISCFLVSWV
jgi:hypothetical protein